MNVKEHEMGPPRSGSVKKMDLEGFPDWLICMVRQIFNKILTKMPTVIVIRPDVESPTACLHFFIQSKIRAGGRAGIM